MKFSGHGARFTMFDDGTVRVRAGVQTNCAGFAAIRVKIAPHRTPEILFRVSAHEGEHDHGFGPAVPGAAVPSMFREAVFKGAKQAFDDNESKIGLVFELLDAMVHEVDASESKFELAGYAAVEGWLESYSRKTPS